MKSDIKDKVLIGIDEAGRGPLAGPVSVGVFVVKSHNILKIFKGVKDSKQLSEKQREEWFGRIKWMAQKGYIDYLQSNNPQISFTWQVAYTVSFSSVKVIDQKGLSYAIRSAINRCLRRLERDGFITTDAKVMLDGSLKGPERFKDQKTIIDGDAKEPIIALASICAKVVRDRYMKRIAKHFPEYGFEIHKGYGTKKHYNALNNIGLCEIHRRSFLRTWTKGQKMGRIKKSS